MKQMNLILCEVGTIHRGKNDFKWLLNIILLSGIQFKAKTKQNFKTAKKT